MAQGFYYTLWKTEELGRAGGEGAEVRRRASMDFWYDCCIARFTGGPCLHRSAPVCRPAIDAAANPVALRQLIAHALAGLVATAPCFGATTTTVAKAGTLLLLHLLLLYE